MKKIIFILVAFSLLLSACGGTPTEETPPPLTGEDVQATAFSMAWTMAAETIAAMPIATNTPIPPTDTPTPIPTSTLIPATTTPEATITPDKDRCDQLLSGWAGKESYLKIVNETKGDVTISLYLSPNNSHNQCGYIYVPSLGNNGSTGLTVPYGTYSVYAWISSGDTQHSLSASGLGIGNPDKHEIIIRNDKIKWLTP